MKRKSKIQLILEILHIGQATYYRYKQKNYPIIKFFNNFPHEKLEEILKNGEIKEFEDLKVLKNTIKEDAIFKYSNTFQNTLGLDKEFLQFYFQFLKKLKNGISDNDDFLFNSSFFLADINQLLFSFLFDYSNGSKIKFNRILRHFGILKRFDYVVLFFLKSALETNLKQFVQKNLELGAKKEMILHCFIFDYICNKKDLEFEEILKRAQKKLRKFNDQKILELESTSSDLVIF